ncbi:hypothetical protein C2E21_9382 [Chlorella sorokiniana]|uniref:Uncharacterized protein n=1 Tax=Chlorella sorokiniana TaxID=3076 RepID=A0A2P6TBJ7_CHLSO|nr:hypothetical protein C2E21_9382 [Chlorella sorokiniana]|eukprot:PRW05930.1 hypothetical protein C2E21_9382 [Chlorella sorokiniana]
MQALPGLVGGTAARPAVLHATSTRRDALRCQAAKGDRGSSGGGRGGSSRGGGGGSGSSGSKRSGSKQKPQRAAPPSGGTPGKQKQREQQQQQALVPPLRTEVLGELSTSDRMPEPLWSTFCGVTNGLWCGITSAHSPFSGQAEPLALNAAGKPLTLLHQCCVEQRAAGEDGTDSVVRHVARADSLEGLQREMAQGGDLQFPPCAVPGAAGDAAGAARVGVNECWEEERFSAGQPGLVIFDGGSYSLGPPAIGSPPQLPERPIIEYDDEAALAAAAALEAALAAAPAADSVELLAEVEEVQATSGEEQPAAEAEEGSEEEGGAVDAVALAAQEQAELDWTAVVIEHCHQWGGEQRLRIRITLDTAGGGDGTDLEIQPLRVSVAREAWEGLPGSFTPTEQGEGAAEQQETSRQLQLDTDSLNGSWKVFEVSAVTVDDVSLQTGLPAPSTLYSAHETLRAFDAALPEDGGDGALLLLPHACGVQLETLRVDNSRRRGLRVATHWSPQPDMLLTTARLYDADGKLLEVATSTAIRHEEA